MHSVNDVSVSQSNAHFCPAFLISEPANVFFLLNLLVDFLKPNCFATFLIDFSDNELSLCIALWISSSIQGFSIFFVTFLLPVRFKFLGPILLFALKWSEYRYKSITILLHHINIPCNHVAVERCSAKL